MNDTTKNSLQEFLKIFLFFQIKFLNRTFKRSIGLNSKCRYVKVACLIISKTWQSKGLFNKPLAFDIQLLEIMSACFRKYSLLL